MKQACFGYGGLFFACVVLAGCSSGGVLSLGQGGNATAPSAAMRTLSLTMAHYVAPVVRTDFAKSWMLSQKKDAKAALIYAGDEETNDVYVYDYSSGKPVGTLTGFDEPYGMCVDAKADVYITNYGAGNAVEYAHGGSKVINTFDSGGTPIGCAVDSKGDVAVTSFDPGEATVFAAGDPSKATTYTSSCTYLWSMGYDDKGNLVGVGETSSGGRCYAGLASGSKSMEALSFNGTIDFPGGSMWDGKYIALGDQEADGDDTGLFEASLSGSTLTSHGEAILTCASGFSDAANPFVVGKKNTPVNDRQGKVVLANCSGSAHGGGGLGFWHYPEGGDPFKIYGGLGDTYGVAVSLGT
jgi:hypothetical protein